MIFSDNKQKLNMFFVLFWGSFSKLLRLLLKVTKFSTETPKWAKKKKIMISPFLLKKAFAVGGIPPQKL